MDFVFSCIFSQNSSRSSSYSSSLFLARAPLTQFSFQLHYFVRILAFYSARSTNTYFGVVTPTKYREFLSHSRLLPSSLFLSVFHAALFKFYDQLFFNQFPLVLDEICLFCRFATSVIYM